MFPQQLKLIETQTKRLNLRLSGVLTWALQVSDEVLTTRCLMSIENSLFPNEFWLTYNSGTTILPVFLTKGFSSNFSTNIGTDIRTKKLLMYVKETQRR